MKPYLPHALAALFAAGAITMAGAAPAPAISFVDEPIAAPQVTGNSVDPLVSQIVQALNADSSLKGSKITVALDENGSVLLTGAALSPVQAARASKIVAASAADKQVVNVIQTDETAYLVPSTS